MHARMTLWIAAAGGFVVSLDAIMNPAFPAIAAAFAAPPERMRWVIVCYVFFYAVVSFVGGALADRVGHARVFRVGLGLTTAAFLLAGAAPTFAWLLVARAVQGVAGGLVYGTAPGLATLAAAPGARGRALGMFSAGMGLGFTAGPMAAGLLVDVFGWRSIFHVRVVPALAVLAWALRGLPAAQAAPDTRLVAVADLVRPVVLHAAVLAFAANAAIFAIWLLAPFYLVGERGIPVAAAGLLFTLTPLGTALGAPVAGWLTDRVGPRLPVVLGLMLEAAGLGLFSRADATTSPVMLGSALLAAGVGVGVFQVPNMATVMAAFPPAQQGAAGGLAFLARTLGVVAGVLTLAQLFAVRRVAVGAGAAFNEAFLAAAAAVALAAALAAVRRPR